jgi:hypothetical protein
MALDKKRRRKQLRKKGSQSSFLPRDTAIVYDLPGAAKMSEALLDFVEPYREMAATEDALRKLLTMASVAWNAALISPAKREALLRSTEDRLPPDLRADYRAILEPLILRKQQHFSDNTRSIVDFELTMERAGPYLRVMSTLPA